MPVIEWTDEMSVGVAEIDAEHRALAESANRLYQAIQKEAGKEELIRLLDELVVLTVSHFVHEERLFARTGYPDREAHAGEHEDLKKQIISVSNRFREGEASLLSADFPLFLEKWLVDHIMTMDMKYGGHLNSCGVR